MIKEIYTPILNSLEKKGIVMIEESANPKAFAKMQASNNRAKM